MAPEPQPKSSFAFDALTSNSSSSDSLSLVASSNCNRVDTSSVSSNDESTNSAMDPAYYLLAGLQLTDTLGGHPQSSIESPVAKTNLAAMNFIAGLVLCLSDTNHSHLSDESSVRGFAAIGGETQAHRSSQTLAATLTELLNALTLLYKHCYILPSHAPTPISNILPEDDCVRERIFHTLSEWGVISEGVNAWTLGVAITRGRLHGLMGENPLLMHMQQLVETAESQVGWLARRKSSNSLASDETPTLVDFPIFRSEKHDSIHKLRQDPVPPSKRQARSSASRPSYNRSNTLPASIPSSSSSSPPPPRRSPPRQHSSSSSTPTPSPGPSIPASADGASSASERVGARSRTTSLYSLARLSRPPSLVTEHRVPYRSNTSPLHNNKTLTGDNLDNLKSVPSVGVDQVTVLAPELRHRKRTASLASESLAALFNPPIDGSTISGLRPPYSTRSATYPMPMFSTSTPTSTHVPRPPFALTPSLLGPQRGSNHTHITGTSPGNQGLPLSSLYTSPAEMAAHPESLSTRLRTMSLRFSTPFRLPFQNSNPTSPFENSNNKEYAILPAITLTAPPSPSSSAPSSPRSLLFLPPPSPSLSHASSSSTFPSPSPSQFPTNITATAAAELVLPPSAFPPLHPVLAAAERASRLKAPVSCSACGSKGMDYPRCGKCAEAWCSRECRIASILKGGGKRHICR